jgi:hypothetical protein
VIVVAQIIDFAEVRGACQAQRAAADERRSLEDAVETIRVNLAAVVERLRDASASERAELVGRIDKLGAMLRYGILLLDGRGSAREGRRKFRQMLTVQCAPR